jgi:flagellar hook-associated protein 2
MRIGGLATGFDTDQMVKDLMRAERIPLNKLFQTKTAVDWQRDAFRDLNLALSSFRDSYSKMRLQSTFNSFGVSSTNDSILTGTATADAAPGTYDVVVNNLAKAAKLHSENAIRDLNADHAITGTGVLSPDATATDTITIDSDFIAVGDVLTIDGKTIEFWDSTNTTSYTGSADYAIDLDDGTGTSTNKLSDTIASEIANLGLTGDTGVSLSANGVDVIISASIDPDAPSAGAAGNSISSGFADSTGSTKLSGVTGTGNLTGGTDKDTITVSSLPKVGDVLTINGQRIDFFDSTEGAYSGSNHSVDISGKTTDQIATDIRALSLGVTLGGTGDQVTITSSTTGVSSSYSSNDSVKSTDKVLTAGGSETFTLSNALGLTTTITVTDTDTYESLAKKISEAKDADGNSLGIRANFDDTTSRFFISTKDMGGNQGFTFENTTFVQDQILGGGTAFSATGEYGNVTFDGITVDNLTSNDTTINGINLTLLKADSTETITLTVSDDTDATFDTIKEFVESYNELITNIEGKLNEPKYRDFPPLTDEQRADLTEKEAELWDEKAKSGLLNNEPLLRSTLNQLRRAFSDPVEGIATGELDHLSEIGITTGSYSNGGKLFIDETKLRAALTNNPDEVMNLFTKQEEVTGNQSQMGVGQRVFEELNNSIDELKRKAGSSITLADQSVLGKNITRLDEQINRWEDRLFQVEERYYRQFTALERAISRLNQQSLFITQNLAGGTGGQ